MGVVEALWKMGRGAAVERECLAGTPHQSRGHGNRMVPSTMLSADKEGAPPAEGWRTLTMLESYSPSEESTSMSLTQIS